MKKEKLQQFLAKKFTDKWIKENKGMLDDYRELCSDLFFFRIKWGIEIGFVFRNSEEMKGRQLGEDIDKRVNEMQKEVNRGRYKTK